ncbi:hypothetical protein HY745_14260, partial [Candidatus Desantisbacteria bacterium]|nr:hypothetical protein [Candidatus Desantisbacteria bacterium]
MTTNDEIDLKQYIAILKKRKKLIFLIWILITFSAFFYNILMPKTYRASGKIFIDKKKMEIKMEPQFQTYSEDISSNTYVMLLTNRTLLNNVIDKLNKSNKFNINLTYDQLSKMIVMNNIHNDLDSKINIFEIIVDTSDPNLSKDISNILLEEYVNFFQQLNSKNNKDINEYITKQISVSRSTLNEEETKLKKFKETNSLELLQKQIKTHIDDLSDNESSLLRINNDLIEMEYLYNQLKEEYNLGKLIISSPLVENSILYQDLRRRILDLEIKKELKDTINDTKETLSGVIKNILEKQDFQIDNLKIKKINIEKNIEKLKKGIFEYQSKIASLELSKQVLERNFTLAQKAYLMLSNKLEEIIIEDKVQPASMKIIEYAEAPKNPISPKILR